jgi:hypothetical protein
MYNIMYNLMYYHYYYHYDYCICRVFQPRQVRDNTAGAGTGAGAGTAGMATPMVGGAETPAVAGAGAGAGAETPLPGAETPLPGAGAVMPMDDRLHTKNRSLRAKRSLKFVEPGTFIRQGDKERLKEERKVIAGYASGRKSSFTPGMLCYGVVWCAVLCYGVVWCAMLWCGVVCYAVICYAVICYAVICYAVICYAMLYFYAINN